MLKQLRCCRSEEVKLWGQGIPQCAAYGQVRLHALQMLAGGDVQKERLTAMRERIMQRTIPIEEVCYICHSHLTGGGSSTPNALLMRCSVKINMYKLRMCAASRADHGESSAKAFGMSSMQTQSDGRPCKSLTGSKAAAGCLPSGRAARLLREARLA